MRSNNYTTTTYTTSQSQPPPPPVPPKVTTTTTITTGPSNPGNSECSQVPSAAQGTVYVQQQGAPEYVHPTGYAQSRPVQSYGVGQGQSQGGLNSGVGQGQSQGGMNPGDAVVETHTETHKKEIHRGKDNTSNQLDQLAMAICASSAMIHAKLQRTGANEAAQTQRGPTSAQESLLRRRPEDVGKYPRSGTPPGTTAGNICCAAAGPTCRERSCVALGCSMWCNEDIRLCGQGAATDAITIANSEERVERGRSSQGKKQRCTDV